MSFQGTVPEGGYSLTQVQSEKVTGEGGGSPLMDEGWLGKATAEFVGTFGLVFFGAGSIVVDEFLGADGYGLLGIAAVYAIVFAVAVSATMEISGGHINPAVTVAAFLTRRMGAALAGAYIVAQLAGGLLGAAFVKALLPASAGQATSFGATIVAEGVGPLTAVTLELVLTFFLVYTVFATAMSDHAPPIGGFAIGACLFFGAMVGGPLTGASMNPARTLGPAIISGAWSLQWVYWVGPILGGALAGAVHDGVVERAGDAEAA